MDIIYFKPSNSSFVLTDQQILERNFSVKPYFINNKNGLNLYICPDPADCISDFARKEG